MKMRKRIYYNMVFLVFVSLILISALHVFLFKSFYEQEIKEELNNKLYLIATGININIQEHNNNYLNYLKSYKFKYRLTLINPQGEVIYDSLVNYKELKTHEDRLELTQALNMGLGKTTRYSETLSSVTYYQAIALADGNVLRISATSQSVYGLILDNILKYLILFALIFLFVHLIAGKLTRRITKPLNNFDFLNFNPKNIYDELVPFVRKIEKQNCDIEEKKNYIEEGTQTVSYILDNLKEALVLLNGHSEIVGINKSALKLFKAEESIINKNIIYLSRDNDILNNIKNAFQGEIKDIILKLNNKYYNASFNLLSDNKLVILFLEVTDKVLAEQKRRRFTGNVSHELKTPLTNIFAYAEMIEKKLAKNEDIEEFAKKIKNESFRVLNLIEDLIALTKLDEASENENSPMLLEEYNLKTLLNEVLESLKLEIKEKNVKINFNVEENIILKGQKKLIFEMFYNLLDNALKYNKINGAVTVNAFNNLQEKFVTVILEDTGLGMPEKNLKEIFERFYKVYEPRFKKTGGSGLGLAVVKHIALWHKIEIKIESEYQVGTKIILLMPKENIKE